MLDHTYLTYLFFFIADSSLVIHVQAGATSNHIRTDHDHLTQGRRKAPIKPTQY